MMGREDHLLPAYLDLSAESSAVDTPSWRSGAPSGSAIPALRRGRGVLAFGDLMSDARGRLWQDRRLGQSENQWSSTRHSRCGRDWWVPPQADINFLLHVAPFLGTPETPPELP